MRSDKEALQDSVNFWSESAEHDKKQFLASFAIAATGLVLVVDGVRNILKGDLGGLLEAGLGGSILVPASKIAYDEIEDYADSKAHVSLRQYELDKLN